MRTLALVYLTLGLVQCFGFWALAFWSPTAERLLEKERELDFWGKCVFWWQFGLGMIFVWPMTWTLYFLARPETRERWSRKYRQEFLEDERWAAKLKPQMPAQTEQITGWGSTRPRQVVVWRVPPEAALDPLPCAWHGCFGESGRTGRVVLGLEWSYSGEQLAGRFFVGLCTEHEPNLDVLERAIASYYGAVVVTNPAPERMHPG